MAEVAGDLIGNKIADEITSVDKPKNKGKEEYDQSNETQEIYRPPEKASTINWKFKIVLSTGKNGIPENHKPIRQHTQNCRQRITKI